MDSRIGPLEFTHDFADGYPTIETTKLFATKLFATTPYDSCFIDLAESGPIVIDMPDVPLRGSGR
jgi:hypothetical protein